MRNSASVVGRRGVAVIIAAIVLLLILTFSIGRQNLGEVPFAGTDAIATETLADAGQEPWFEPFFAPASGEIESGLFALQAGLGGIALGYVFGRLRGRSSREEEAEAAG